MSARRTVRARLGIAAGLLHLAATVHAQTPPDYLVRQLTPSGDPASRVSSWEIDPRGEWVAFVGDVESAGQEAAYAMRRNGSELRRLSSYGAPGTIDFLRFSPDGRRVLYAGDLETNGRRELWSVLLPGSAVSAVKLSLAVTGMGVVMTQLPETGNRLVYLAETAAGRKVRSVPIAGPATSTVELNPPLQGAEIPYIAQTTVNGAHAVVTLVDPVAMTSRIYSVPMAGPAASAVLLADANPGGCFYVPGDSNPVPGRLLYFGNSCPSPGGSGTKEAWSVPITGPANAAISLVGSFADGGSMDSGFLSPDGQHLVFTADKLVDERFELFSVPVLGPAGSLVKLNPTLAANGDVEGNFVISPDSTRVAYVADQSLDTYANGWVVPIDGSAAALPLFLGPTMVSGDVVDLEFSADGSHIAYRGDFTVTDRFDLYWTPGDGVTGPVRITNRGSMPVSGRSVAFRRRIHPDESRVFYVFDEAVPDDERGLGEQRISGPYTQDLQLNGVPVPGGQVSRFELYSDGAGLLYSSDETADGKLELFTVDTRIFGDGFEEGTTAAWTDVP